jgi:hypothetical protein
MPALLDADVETDDAGSTETVGSLPAAHGFAAVASGGTLIPSGCVSVGMLPDRRCTPGATNPAVTPATLRATICFPGWASSTRPPASVTTPIKRRMVAAYGNPPTTKLEDSRLDHLVPLSIGGDPRAIANLWPQRATESVVKDRVELAANTAVCAGRLPLAEAQRGFSTNWTALGKTLHVAGL